MPYLSNLRNPMNRIRYCGLLAFLFFFYGGFAQTDSIYWTLFPTGPGLGAVSPVNPNLIPDTVGKGTNFQTTTFTVDGYANRGKFGGPQTGWNESSIGSAFNMEAFVEFSFYVACPDSFTISSVSFDTKTNIGSIAASNSLLLYSTSVFTLLSPPVGNGQFTADSIASFNNSYTGLTIQVAPGDTIRFRLYGALIGANQYFLYVKNFKVRGSVNRLPLVDAGNPFTINCIQNVSGDTLGVPGQSGSVYSWAPVAGLNSTAMSNPIANPTSTTVYTVTQTYMTNGCTAIGTDTVRVIVDNAPPPLSLSNDTVTLCSGDTVQLTASGAGSYSWLPAAGLNTTVGSVVLAFPSANQVYFVTGISATNGCSDTDTVRVQVNIPFTLPTGISGNNVLCSGDSIIRIVQGGNPGTGGTWNWFSDSCKGSLISTGDSIQITDITVFNPKTRNIYVRAVGPGPCPIDTQCVSASITINPVPYLVSTKSDTICSQDPLHYSLVSSVTNNVNYSWTSMAGSGISGNSQHVVGSPQDSVISDTLKNNIFISDGQVVYNVLLTYTNNGLSCISDTQKVSVVVEPAPPDPVISILEGIQNNDTLCGGSEHISFRVSPVPGVTYNWTVTPANVYIHLSDTVHPPFDSSNVIITFPDSALSYQASIEATPKTLQNFSGCKADTAMVRLTINPGGITERGIVERNPGNLLVYLDNSVSGYQWGYDSIPTLKASIIEGQVYQLFVPVDTGKFLVKKNGVNQLDTTTYIFWVDAYLRQGGENCLTKIYYNGPFAQRPGKQPDAIPSEISLVVAPNPSRGSFTLLISGNIYGMLKIQLSNTYGQTVMNSLVEKSAGRQQYSFDSSRLVPGLYFLHVFNSEGEKYVLKLIVN